MRSYFQFFKCELIEAQVTQLRGDEERKMTTSMSAFSFVLFHALSKTKKNSF